MYSTLVSAFCIASGQRKRSKCGGKCHLGVWNSRNYDEAEEIDLRDANIWRSDPVPANWSDLVCAAILLSRVVKAKTEKAVDIFQDVTRVLPLLRYCISQKKIACQSLGFELLLQVRSHKTSR